MFETLYLSNPLIEPTKNFNNYIDKINKYNETYYKTNNKRKTYFITTFGCQMNEHDSEEISGMLNNMGFEESFDIDQADIVIYNTCAIRENAEQRFFGNVSSIKRIKKDDADKIIVTCGCMMQQEHVVNEIKKNYKFIDIVFGTHNVYKFPELLYKHIENKDNSKQIIDILDIDGKIIEDLPSSRKYSYKAYVNIMYGCNNFCSYCVVPYTRGRERSRDPEDIISEIKELVKTGVIEVTLLGQNVNSYGKTLENKNYKFVDLLKEVNKIEGLQRIRFMTSHPKDLSDELIHAVSDLDKVCENIHLPVQSGSSRILRKMNRGYTKEQYLEKINKIKEINPNITLSTDIIVGFPSETYEDFQETLDVIKKVKYDNMFMFLYSPREGTPAKTMDEQIPEEEKKRRFNELLELSNDIAKDMNAKYLDTIQEVIVEGPSKKNKDIYSGRTRDNKLVNFKGNNLKEGSLINVKITNTKSFSLDGEAI